jgi:hypothetical protein
MKVIVGHLPSPLPQSDDFPQLPTFLIMVRWQITIPNITSII